MKCIPYLGKYGERRSNLGRQTEGFALAYGKSGRNITFENFFSDKELILWLAQQGLTGVGTVRRDKCFLPESFKHGKDLKKGDSSFVFHEAMSLVSHKSNHKKNVIVTSSMHDKADVDEESEKRKPEMVKYYNKTKGRWILSIRCVTACRQKGRPEDGQC